MLIKEIAKRVGVSIDTIRFYEKQGLLDETHFQRSPNGYRHYSEASLQRLSLIKMGQAAGFTLSEMRRTVQAWETDELTPDEKVFYICRKLEEIEQKRQALENIKDYLQSKIDTMREQPDATP